MELPDDLQPLAMLELLIARLCATFRRELGGFWGNDAVDQKLHDIAASDPSCYGPTCRS